MAQETLSVISEYLNNPAPIRHLISNSVDSVIVKPTSTRLTHGQPVIKLSAMGGYEPNNYDDVSNYLNFPNDSDDEDIANTPRPRETESKDQTMSTPLSPPASSADDDAIEDDQDEDDLYGSSNYNDWKARRNSNAASLDSPVNPQWLSSDQPPRRSSLSIPDHHNPSTPTSDDAKSPGDRRTALQTIQEKNELLIKTQVTAKTSKSFPLLPDLLSLKQAEDEDEKILASEEGKRLNPRERRQLRNKVSARNFRVRRKGNYDRCCLLIDRIHRSP